MVTRKKVAAYAGPALPRLTLEQALRGDQPVPLTREEWKRVWRGSIDAEHDARLRTARQMYGGLEL